VLQTTELVVAVIFVDISVHVSNGRLLVAAAIAFAAMAVTAKGPLGIIRVCGQRLHLVLVMATAAVVAIAPIVPALRPDIEGIIVVEFGAVGLFRLATFTRSSESFHGAVPSRRGAKVIDATATVVHPGAPSGATPATRRPSPASTAPTPAARRMGRSAGAAAATGRRVVAKRRPEAEARIKRTIRGAGRLAGRATSAAADTDTPPR
jgi:hypothetical protein